VAELLAYTSGKLVVLSSFQGAKAEQAAAHIDPAAVPVPPTSPGAAEESKPIV
jgi:hypothetical protein